MDTLAHMADGVDTNGDEPDDVRRLETELRTLLRRSRSYLDQAARDVHPDLGATAYALLAWLIEHGPARASDLVEVFDIDKAAISRQTGLLESLGLVGRQPDATDRRALLITPTDTGVRLARSARSRSQRELRHHLEQWSSEDVRDLGLLLERFNAIPLDHDG